MHNLLDNRFRNTLGTIALTSLVPNPAAATDAAEIQQLTPCYYLHHAKQSYSEVAHSIQFYKRPTSSVNFAQEISEFYHSLSMGQEPLGAEFEALWDANVELLYED